ncbi:MAG: twin-arginine translocase TatA/TatE family subunit [bacterium]
MFGIGMSELIIILIIALIVFGPKRMPEMGKALGRAMKEFRKATQELKEELQFNESGGHLEKEKTKELLG